jgi:hypothetical protein
VASLVCPLYLGDHITSTFAYKNLSVVFVPEYSHDSSWHIWLGWMHNMDMPCITLWPQVLTQFRRGQCGVAMQSFA